MENTNTTIFSLSVLLSQTEHSFASFALEPLEGPGPWLITNWAFICFLCSRAPGPGPWLMNYILSLFISDVYISLQVPNYCEEQKSWLVYHAILSAVICCVPTQFCGQYKFLANQISWNKLFLSKSSVKLEKKNRIEG